jgi:flagellin-like hook-associated protein FlgL
MSISSIGAQSSAAIQSLVKMRAELDDLQRQISTGQKSDTYAGLGLDRGLTIGLRAQLSAASAYTDTITNVGTRISIAQTALGRVGDVGNTIRSTILQANAAGTNAGTLQATAKTSLDELLGLLNTQAGDRYLFSGRDTDKPAVESIGSILDGDGSRAGLKQMISERLQADLGTSGNGRLTISAPTTTSVSVDDEASPFGIKLASASSTLSNATVTGPGGTPPSNLTVDFSGVPNEGETLTVRVTLPDGSTENLTLTATTKSPPGDNEFTIGATPDENATNLQAALSTSIDHLAKTSLTAASAVQASNEFFDADLDHPPLRVDGPPFDSATGLVPGTAANSVIWYTGDDATDPARNTATAQIDKSLSVNYGVRASEEGIRDIVQNVATLAAVSINSTSPDAADLSAALNTRLTGNLSNSDGGQTVADIQAELAGAQTSMAAAKDRHQQTEATLGDFLQGIAGVSNEEAGAQILALQTRMQASMQTTAMLFQTSLVNYLS